ncbi:MAG: glycosyltransferase family 4 protein [Chitinophagales bacterium]|nr:glycosyltransferase family 4 protein [Chitinophagales bacterium]
MFIAIVTNSFPTNSETFIINKVLALASVNNHITVIRLAASGSKDLMKLYNFKNNSNIAIKDAFVPSTTKELIKFSLKKPITIFTSFATNKKKLYQNLRNNILLNLFNNNNFDIVHFEFSGIAVGFLDIIPNIKAKTVMSCRGSAEKVKLLTEPNRAKNLEKTLEVIDAIHCVSEDMKQTILPYCNKPEKIFVNRPAIDVNFFSPKNKTKNNTSTNILSIGRFTFQKGYIFGLLAIKQLVQKGYNITWNIIGDGIQEEEIIFHIHTLQLQNNIVLLGKKNKDEVNEYLSNTDIFFLTSVYEGIPNVVLEAMAMELPVVTTKSGGVDEVIDNGIDGLIAQLYDIEQLASLLEKLITDKTFADNISKKARQKIIKDYTLQRQLEVFVAEYQKLLS